MIEYNTKENSLARQQTKALTLEENNEVVRILNCHIPSESEALVQRFINHYQNLDHHMAYTCGLWATDRKELASHEDFFEIEF